MSVTRLTASIAKLSICVGYCRSRRGVRLHTLKLASGIHSSWLLLFLCMYILALSVPLQWLLYSSTSVKIKALHSLSKKGCNAFLKHSIPHLIQDSAIKKSSITRNCQFRSSSNLLIHWMYAVLKPSIQIQYILCFKILNNVNRPPVIHRIP